MSLFQVGLTDHLEGPRDQPSEVILEEVSDLVRLADELGVHYAWFSEHHAHAHQGHLPAPLLLALHLAGQTRNIRLGTAIICLNLHHPLDVAEQVTVADLLTKGRMAVGFGSGSTPEEFSLFGLAETGDLERHARFEESLRLILSAWSKHGIRVGPESGSSPSMRFFSVPPHQLLPTSAADLPRRCWVAVNSIGSARIAGDLDFNVLFSHLRTPEQYREYTRRLSNEQGAQAFWRQTGRSLSVPTMKLPSARLSRPFAFCGGVFNMRGKLRPRPRNLRRPEDLCIHPINFIVGGPQSVARQLRELHNQAPFDIANVEVRWAGLRMNSFETA